MDFLGAAPGTARQMFESAERIASGRAQTAIATRREQREQKKFELELKKAQEGKPADTLALFTALSNLQNSVLEGRAKRRALELAPDTEAAAKRKAAQEERAGELNIEIAVENLAQIRATNPDKAREIQLNVQQKEREAQGLVSPIEIPQQVSLTRGLFGDSVREVLNTTGRPEGIVFDDDGNIISGKLPIETVQAIRENFQRKVQLANNSQVFIQPQIAEMFSRSDGTLGDLERIAMDEANMRDWERARELAADNLTVWQNVGDAFRSGQPNRDAAVGPSPTPIPTGGQAQATSPTPAPRTNEQQANRERLMQNPAVQAGIEAGRSSNPNLTEDQILETILADPNNVAFLRSQGAEL